MFYVVVSIDDSYDLTSWNWLLGIYFSGFYCFAVKIYVRDVVSAFSAIAWLTSLKKMTSELTYGTLIFYEDLLVNSVHLSSANLVCPNY